MSTDTSLSKAHCTEQKKSTLLECLRCLNCFIFLKHFMKKHEITVNKHSVVMIVECECAGWATFFDFFPKLQLWTSGHGCPSSRIHTWLQLTYQATAWLPVTIWWSNYAFRNSPSVYSVLLRFYQLGLRWIRNVLHDSWFTSSLVRSYLDTYLAPMSSFENQVVSFTASLYALHLPPESEEPSSDLSLSSEPILRLNEDHII